MLLLEASGDVAEPGEQALLDVQICTVPERDANLPLALGSRELHNHCRRAKEAGASAKHIRPERRRRAAHDRTGPHAPRPALAPRPSSFP
eukprot:scaffold49468_cov28-Tisochrysis_lutea.AAC.5